jgi:hypothetical protein
VLDWYIPNYIYIVEFRLHGQAGRHVVVKDWYKPKLNLLDNIVLTLNTRFHWKV